jgi:hypothetical protein
MIIIKNVEGGRGSNPLSDTILASKAQTHSTASLSGCPAHDRNSNRLRS